MSRIAWAVSVLAAVSPVLIGQAPNQQQGGLPTVAIDPPAEVVASDIPGVIKGGTKVRLVRAGFNGAESPISMSDGSLLFVEYEANKVIKIDNAGNASTPALIGPVRIDLTPPTVDGQPTQPANAASARRTVLFDFIGRLKHSATRQPSERMLV